MKNIHAVMSSDIKIFIYRSISRRLNFENFEHLSYEIPFFSYNYGLSENWYEKYK